ncbi:MAG: glycosyltransferase family 2 protein [Planctomycetes bacterium]|nr:glycosyltransferase family 2 protein [Planctomycetota bacterium]
MNSTPRVSLIMAVYNGEKHLEASIDSLLGQSYGDFEVIIVNDGSHDKTPEILKKYLQQDKRIIIIHNENNLGLTPSLTKATAQAKGEYLARLDCGDLAHETRLEKQIRILDKNPECVMCATQVHKIDHQNQIIRTQKAYMKKSFSKEILLFANPFVHSTVVMRKEAYLKAGGYDDYFQCSQDHNLWTRLIFTGSFQLIDEVLVDSRQDTDGISFKKAHKQTEFAAISSTRLLEQLDSKATNKRSFEFGPAKFKGENAQYHTFFKAFFALIMSPAHLEATRISMIRPLVSSHLLRKSFWYCSWEVLLKTSAFLLLGSHLYQKLFTVYSSKRYGA